MLGGGGDGDGGGGGGRGGGRGVGEGHSKVASGSSAASICGNDVGELPCMAACGGAGDQRMDAHTDDDGVGAGRASGNDSSGDGGGRGRHATGWGKDGGAGGQPPQVYWQVRRNQA